MRHTLKGWILRIHKWIGICLGIIIFAWLVSGMVMIVPPPAPPRAPQQAIDYRAATISPAQAAALIATREQDTAPVRKLAIITLLGRSFYLAEMGGGQTHLIDVQSGASLRVTPDVAEAIARQASGGITSPATVTELTRHGADYIGGPLPAFRVDFDDSRGSSVFVSPRDGSSRYTTRSMRARFFISNLHTFDHLRLLPNGEPARKPLLHLASLIGIALVLTGYYMVLPKSWRPKRPDD